MLISEKDIKFIHSIQEEVMSNMRLQQVDYITTKNILGFNDEYDNLYKEQPKEEIVFNDPITIDAFVHTKIPEYLVGEYGLRYLRTIIVMVHKNYELENGLEINIGQFFKWNDHLYQILLKTGEEVQIWGNPEWLVYSNYVAVMK